MAKQQGLSLLELLIAMLIISILAMVGLPTYSDYRIRVKLSEDLATIQQVKLLVSEYYATTGNLPTANDQIGLDRARDIKGRYLRRLRIQANPEPGTIRAVYDNRIFPQLGTNVRLDFVPTPVGGGRLAWDYTHGDLQTKYRPANCRG